MKKVHIISKASPTELPPVINVALTFEKLGYEVVVITQNVAQNITALFSNSNVEVKFIKNPLLSSPIDKLKHWGKFRQFVKKHIQNIKEQDLVWVTGADTGIALYNVNFVSKNLYFQVNELHNDDKIYNFFLKKIIPKMNKIIVASSERASMYQVWFNLISKPYVFPNKPYSFDFDGIKKAKELEKYIEIINTEKTKGKKIIIYQGYIFPDRDLSNIIRSIKKREKDFALVLMGQDYGMLEKYKSIHSDLIYIPPINSPNHLFITQNCDIGILNYLPTSLNNIFCAPNKIWEYSNFGLVMIGNDIPGLSILDSERMGVSVNINNETEIDLSLNEILENFETYKENSSSYFDKNKLDKILKNILN